MQKGTKGKAQIKSSLTYELLARYILLQDIYSSNANQKRRLFPIYWYQYVAKPGQALLQCILDSDRTRENSSKLKKRRLDVRRKVFAVGVVRYWNRLPKEAADSPPWKCSRPG